MYRVPHNKQEEMLSSSVTLELKPNNSLYFPYMSHGGGGKEGEGAFIYTELKKASDGFLSFIANLITAFVNVFVGTDSHH